MRFNIYLIAALASFGTAAAAQNPGNQPLPRAAVEGQLKANFARMDTNKDGIVTREESSAIRGALIDQRLNESFNAMDADKNGSISRGEFANANKRAIAAANGGKAIPDNDFQAADGNRDGKVTLAEAMTVPLRNFDAADANKDGMLTVAERKAFAQRGARRK